MNIMITTSGTARVLCMSALVAISLAQYRPVDRYAAVWENLPTGVGSFYGPYVGNGDIGAVYSAPNTGKDTKSTGVQVLSLGTSCDSFCVLLHSSNAVAIVQTCYVISIIYVCFAGKNDFWTSEGKVYFNHLSAPTVTYALPAGQFEGTTTMDMGEDQNAICLYT